MRSQRTPRPERGFVAEWTVTIVLLLFGTTTLAQAFVIPSGSMEDTLLVGDHVIVDRLAYSPSDAVTRHLLPYTEVRRGDIIVFRYPLDLRKNLVKRAMGLPGDRIHIVNKTVWLNGHPLNEPYAVHKTEYTILYRDSFPADAPSGLRPEAVSMLAADTRNGDLVVPPGHIFAMGDNRDNSDDSRFWGLLPMENVIGKPVLVYWSYDAPTEELSDPSVNVNHLIDVALHFPTKTRWSRTFRLIRSYPVQ